MVALQHLTIPNKSSTPLINIANCVQGLLNNLRENNNLNCAEKFVIADILLDICEDCARMASLPQSAFAACKLRDKFQDREMLVARMKSGNDKNDAKNLNTNKKLTEYSPAKYNGKLMNSIWGFYNRYSPHNIKGNEYESGAEKTLVQQQFAVASHVIAEKLALALRSDKEWTFRRD